MTRKIAQVVLWGLLLVLAVRLTMTEQARQTLAQMTTQHTAAVETKGGAVPMVGPGTTTGLAAITFLLAGIAAWCAGVSGALTLRRLGRFALIAVVLALGTVSALEAADRFVAVVGLSDLAMALLAGWAVGLLCQRALLGDRGRRMVVMAIVALLAAWAAKGIYQRTIDIPETIAYFNAHKEEALDQALGPSQNRSPEDSDVKLFESRMNSKEVTGFVTLSNVMGTGMVGLLAVLAGMIGLAANGLREARAEEAPRGGKGEGGGEIPLPVLLLCLAVLVELAGMATLFLSASRGASVIGVAVIAAVFAGAFGRRWVVKRRRRILATAAIAVILGAAAGIGYGLARDRLPGKSLMFRWHYWTASAKLIERSPWEGVGLNNFGDYYTAVKRSSSPEDVKDPHSFFVRIAAEMGVPAAGAVGLLILGMILGATRVTEEKEAANASGAGIASAIAGGAIFCAAWWAIHQLVAEAPDLYSVELSVLYAVLTAAAWALAAGMLGLAKGRDVRFLALAALGGAAGMLLYDQINMALVTGPVAMLFWVLLGMSDSYDSPPPISPTAAGGVRRAGAMASTCIAAGVVLTAGFWWPTVEGRMAWDSSPYVLRYLEVMQRAANGETPDFAAAQAALEQAIARSPRAVDLRRQLMLVKLQLHEPVAGDIRAILQLDQANARIRMDLAMPESDLPAAERIAILQQALRFDDTLPADEVMRLGAANRAAIEAKIGALRQETTMTLPEREPGPHGPATGHMP